MQPFPLKSLAFYKVRKDFIASDRRAENYTFKRGTVLQFQRTNSNIYDMLEIMHFVDIATKQEVIWETYVERVYEKWQEYLEPVPNPFLKA